MDEATRRHRCARWVSGGTGRSSSCNHEPRWRSRRAGSRWCRARGHEPGGVTARAMARTHVQPCPCAPGSAPDSTVSCQHLPVCARIGTGIGRIRIARIRAWARRVSLLQRCGGTFRRARCARRPVRRTTGSAPRTRCPRRCAPCGRTYDSSDTTPRGTCAGCAMHRRPIRSVSDRAGRRCPRCLAVVSPRPYRHGWSGKLNDGKRKRNDNGNRPGPVDGPAREIQCPFRGEITQQCAIAMLTNGFPRRMRSATPPSPPRHADRSPHGSACGRPLGTRGAT